MAWFLLIFLLLPANSIAQSKGKRPAGPKPKPAAAAVPTRWPIQSLTVEGNRIYATDRILRIAGLRTGQLAGKEEFEAARDRLLATGAFETVGYRFAPAPNSNSYEASFQVVEATPVLPIRFEGLGVSDQDLNAWLKTKNPLLGPKIPGTASVIEQYSRAIQDFLQTRNVEETVAGKVTATGPDQFSIVFRPAKPVPAVAEVSFEGNQVIPSEVLQNAISGVAFGAPFTEAGFRQLLDNTLRPLYEAKGRIRVAFPTITSEPAKEVKGLLVKVVIEEGPSYDLGEVHLAGSSAVSSKELLKTANLKPGELANFDDVAKGVDRIKKRLRRDGYMRADARVERNIKEKTVNLTIQIEEGPQFLFGKLNIQGLDIHGEAAVKKLWALKEGKPFNADYPNFFLERIREDGVFENLGKTRAVVNADEQTHTVDVTLHFR